MAAHDNLQGEQLAMFMPAGKLRTYDSVDRMSSSISQLWDKKLRESKVPADPYAHGSGVYDSVQKKGVLNPVNVSYKRVRGDNIPTMGNGNHRVAAQADIDPNRLVPVIHHDNLSDATLGGYEPATKRVKGHLDEKRRKSERANARPLGTATNQAIDRLGELL